MKLHELANIVGKGDKTNLTGGPLPNVYRDDASKASKKPRKKKKDVYGFWGYGVGVGNTSGDSGDMNGDMSTGGDATGAAATSTASTGTGGTATGGGTGGAAAGGSGGGAGGGGAA